MTHDRTAEFRSLLADVLAGLTYVLDMIAALTAIEPAFDEMDAP